MELVPIKITIRRGNVSRGEPAMKYPAGHNPMDIDQHGIGMHYGKTFQLGLGHETEFAITALPKAMADEYVAGSGGDVVVLTEEEAEAFFTDHVPEAEVVIDDRNAIDAVMALSAAGLPIPPKLKNAIDPEHTARGVRWNPRRGLAGKLGARKLHPSVAKKR